jgi:hypothetical protein
VHADDPRPTFAPDGLSSDSMGARTNPRHRLENQEMDRVLFREHGTSQVMEAKQL